MANMVQKIRTTYTLVNGLNILKVFASLTYDVETLYLKYEPINIAHAKETCILFIRV